MGAPNLAPRGRERDPGPDSVRVGDPVAIELRPGIYMRGYAYTLVGRNGVGIEWPDGTSSVVSADRIVDGGR